MPPSPHHLHEAIYLDVLNAGKDLLAEKPFGIDLEAAPRNRQRGKIFRALRSVAAQSSHFCQERSVPTRSLAREALASCSKLVPVSTTAAISIPRSRLTGSVK